MTVFDKSTAPTDDTSDNTLMNGETIEREDKLECYLSSHLNERGRKRGFSSRTKVEWVLRPQ